MPKDIKDNWEEWVDWAIDKFIRNVDKRHKRELNPQSNWPIKNAKERGK